MVLAHAVSRRGGNFSLISTTEGNQDDCIVNGSGMRSMRVIYFHVSKWVFWAVFLFVFRRTKNANACSPWNPSVVSILDTLMLLDGGCFKLTPGACILFLSSLCFSALCYLVQQQAANNSQNWTLGFSSAHLCLYSGECSKLFIIKHCLNKQVKIYWHKGGWEEGVAGWSSASTSSYSDDVEVVRVPVQRLWCVRLLPKSTAAGNWILSAVLFSLCSTGGAQARECLERCPSFLWSLGFWKHPMALEHRTAILLSVGEACTPLRRQIRLWNMVIGSF